MAWSQEQLTALESALALGVKKVKYGDKETEYQTLDEMIRLRDLMKSEINGVDSIRNRRTIGIFRSTNNKT